MLLGVTAHSFGDAYAVEGSTFTIAAATIAFSTMYFLQNRIGSGFFVRGDIGFSQLRAESSDAFGRTIGAIDSERGTGWLLGGGYGLPVSRGTRLLFHLNYASKTIERDSYNNWAISVSGLF